MLGFLTSREPNFSFKLYRHFMLVVHKASVSDFHLHPSPKVKWRCVIGSNLKNSESSESLGKKSCEVCLD